MKKTALAVTLTLLFSMPAASQAEGDIYTIYRTSPTDASMRLKIATFDSKESETYNRENCLLAASLFATQPGVKAPFFCEKGRFRPSCIRRNVPRAQRRS